MYKIYFIIINKKLHKLAKLKLSMTMKKNSFKKKRFAEKD